SGLGTPPAVGNATALLGSICYSGAGGAAGHATAPALVGEHTPSVPATTSIFVFMVAGTAIEKVPTRASGGDWLV
ncbi:MAG TPA: hypothetical protein VGF38_12325, partial [Ktedonobacterales bacterium]